ncbi:MAG: PQQ-binding-like beta-propeller repeat protein, partial [Planctomycetota bacterium]
ILTVVVLCLSFTQLFAEGDSHRWPEFRGPGGQGHSSAKNLPSEWSETKNVVWKTPITGRGWSSPVVENGEIWMTSAIETPATEDEKKERLKSNTGSQPLNVAGRVSFRAVGCKADTGELIADVELMLKKSPQPVHDLNSYASPTPILENGRLYCHFGTEGTVCLDTKTKKIVWTNDDLKLAHENGPGSSPILWKDLIIFHCDGSDVQFVAALDKKTGKVRWKTDRSGKMHAHPQMKKAYGTPLVVEIAGRPQLVSPGADWLYSYDPSSGDEIWKVKYGVLGFSLVPRPVTGHGRVYMCTSFMRSELLAFRFDDKKTPYIDWRYKKQVPAQPSPLLIDDSLYFVSDKAGVLTCLDAITGKARWMKRIGGNYSSSLLYADGKVFAANRTGVTTVFRPGKEFDLVSKNELDGRIMATPVAVGRALYIRTDKALYRIEGAKKTSVPTPRG